MGVSGSAGAPRRASGARDTVRSLPPWGGGKGFRGGPPPPRQSRSIAGCGAPTLGAFPALPTGQSGECPLTPPPPPRGRGIQIKGVSAGGEAARGHPLDKKERPLPRRLCGGEGGRGDGALPRERFRARRTTCPPLKGERGRRSQARDHWLPVPAMPGNRGTPSPGQSDPVSIISLPLVYCFAKQARGARRAAPQAAAAFGAHKEEPQWQAGSLGRGWSW